MKSVSQSEAKAIVDKFLSEYSYTNIDLDNALKKMWSKPRKFDSTLKREEFIKKNFNKFRKGIYFQQVNAHFTMQIGFAVQSNNVEHTVSQAQIKKERLTQLEYKRYQHNLRKQFFNLFAVKEAGKSILRLFMFNPLVREPSKINELYSITTVTRHCLERVIERMNLNSVEEALDEIVSSLQWLESSNKELSCRPNIQNGLVKFKRHIPTTNGALLLTNYTTESSGMESVLEGHLVTWINKEQFFKGQEVTTKEFNFVQAVNYLLSNTNKLDETAKYKECIKELSAELPIGDSVITIINGEIYPAERFITAMDNGEYLDYIIDFER